MFFVFLQITVILYTEELEKKTFSNYNLVTILLMETL